MTPLKALKAVVREMRRRKCSYCLVGGHAASLYRRNERVTKDVDFALFDTNKKRSKETAQRILKSLGFKPVLGFIRAGPDRKKSSGKVYLITSQPEPEALTGIIDILLPEHPWLKEAVERAQLNQLDLGFAHVPVITPEDLIVAKLFALKNTPDRFQDMDDIKEIFQAIEEIDTDYLRERLKKHRLRIPAILSAAIPKRLKEFLSS